MLRPRPDGIHLMNRDRADVFCRSFDQRPLFPWLGPGASGALMGHSSLAMIQNVYSHLPSQDADGAGPKTLAPE